MAGKFSVEGIIKLTDRFSRPAARMVSSFERATRSARMGVDSMNKSVDRMGGGLLKFGALAAGAGAVAAVGLKALVEPTFAVEDSLAKVATAITPATGTIQDALAATKDAAIAWSKQHVASAEDFIEANYRMASAGLDSTKAIAGTKAALTLATAAMGDAETAGNLLATMYNNMGNHAANADTEMMRLADVVAKTQAKFQLADLSQLNEGLKLATPSAIQFGMSVEQLTAAVGLMNSKGLQGSMAGTAFAASMRQMSKASKELHFSIAKTASGGVDFAGTLQNIEKKFGTFQKMTDKQKAAFQQAFGDEGLRGISLLIGHTDELSAGLAAIQQSAGAASAAAAGMEATHNNAFKILGNRVDAVKMQLAEGLLPTLDRMNPAIDSAVRSVSAWADANKDLIATKIGDFVQKIADNKDSIVQWGEGIAIAGGALVGLKVALFAASTAFDAYTLAAKGVGLVVDGVQGGAKLLAAALNSEALASAGSALAAGGNALAQGARNMALGLGKVATADLTKETVIATGAGWANAASSWGQSAATWAKNAATKAFTVSATAATGITGTLTSAATAASTAIAGAAASVQAAVAPFAPFLATVGAAAAAIGALVLAWQQWKALNAETGGLGVTGTIGEMISQGTFDPFKAVDEFQNRQARAAAGTAPAAAGGEQPRLAPRESTTRTETVERVQLELPKGVKATREAPKGSNLRLAPSGGL